jgi:urease accessory protein
MLIVDCRVAGEETRPVISPFVNRHSSFDRWLFLQLADSAFPTGGFAHSAGLEAAWQHGEIRNRHELVSYIEACLYQLGHAALPFVTAAHNKPYRLEEFDNLCESFITNHIANRASRAQGKAFLNVVQRIFFQGDDINRQTENDLGVRSQFDLTPNGSPVPNGPRHPKPPPTRFAHFAPIFGACLCSLNVAAETTNHLFFFSHLRSLVAAAVRLNIVGPMEAQSLQHRLAPKAQKIIEKCESLTLDNIAQTSPLLDLWQSTHDRLYSRLFQS